MLNKLSYVHEMHETANQQVTGQVARNQSRDPRNFNKECM